jgi:hyperosmotically inducible protein
MKSLVLFTALALVAVGCKSADRSHTDTTNTNADNTKINQRDKNLGALTPLDQGENTADLRITKTIREAVVKSGDFSMTAKNVKIITVDGVVTLRGPVTSAREKDELGSIAAAVDGVKRLDNQLDVKAN